MRSHLLMCRHCRRFIRQMRLTQATVRHLPEGRAGTRPSGRASLRIAQGRRAALSRGILDTKPPPAIRGRRLFAPLSGVGEPNPAWHGWLSFRVTEVEECGWAWRISLRDMRPTEGRQSVSLGGHPKSRRTPGTWRISPTDISSRGNPRVQAKGREIFRRRCNAAGGAPSIGARTPYRRPLPTSGVTHEKISLASSVVGAALLGVASVGAHAAQNPFAVQELSSGYGVAAAGRPRKVPAARPSAVPTRASAKPPRQVMKAAAVRITRPGRFLRWQKKAGEGNCGADKEEVSKA